MASPEKVSKRDLDRIANQIEATNTRLSAIISEISNLTDHLWPEPDGEGVEAPTPVPCGVINRIDYGLKDQRNHISAIEFEVGKLHQL